MKLKEIIPLTAGKIELIDNETLETIGVFEDKYYYRTEFEKEYGEREVLLMRSEQDTDKVKDDAEEPWFMTKMLYFNHYTTLQIHLGKETTE